MIRNMLAIKNTVEEEEEEEERNENNKYYDGCSYPSDGMRM